ncbi:hypothetical protein ABFV83_10060 [Lacrimispora sp. BS-2]|uniref:Uncharacterized protein n=1 Tax=Lacrimispora sp. BS-2 TaxID=3151850 RepID=A0AAU7PWK6_9FIRM
MLGKMWNHIKELVRGNECGGSMRGDYVQLYLEKKTGKIIPGTQGFYGGFGGYSSVYKIYQNYDKDSYIYLQWIGQGSGNFTYNDDFLLKSAHLFYDGNDVLAKDHILETEYMAAYYINDVLASAEDFNKELEKYTFVPMKLK